MSLSNTETVDAIGIDKKTGFLILTIIDDLSWEDESAHLNLLQDKLNTYLSFLESGEVYQAYPLARDKSININVVFRSVPTSGAVSFINEAAEVLKGAGFGLTTETYGS